MPTWLTIGVDSEQREDGFAARKRYLADHDGDRQKIERIDELLGARALNVVANTMIETPEYLKELIGDYRSAKHKGPLDRRRHQGRGLPPPPRHHRPCVGLRCGAAGSRAVRLAASARKRLSRPSNHHEQGEDSECAERSPEFARQPVMADTLADVAMRDVPSCRFGGSSLRPSLSTLGCP